MRIALFGGAFDPPHRGHRQIGEEVIQRQVVDAVWYVPVFEHPWAERLGKHHLAPYQARKEMVELILPQGAELKEFLEVSYTYPTLVHFSEKYPEHEFSWLLGSEYLESFKDWKFADQILAEFKVYVYPRPGHPLKNLLPGMTALHDFPEIPASSQEIRQLIDQGRSISELVDPTVERYIQQHQLYE